MKIKKIVGYLGIFIFAFSVFLNPINANNDYTVTTRDLAMLASLVYEDVPDNSNYDSSYVKKNSKKVSDSCIINGKLISGCFYTAYPDTENKDYFVKYKNSQDLVLPYIEGMSARKARGASLVSSVTANFQEDGEKYYLLNFAHTQEMKDKGWTIYDYASEDTKGSLKKWIRENSSKTQDFKGTFDAVTFKNGNNYVIAYRGTDFPDLMEWVDDVLYAANGEHSEASLAYRYAQVSYDKIVKENQNAKIYITGHSLGAYLAQIGGAAIVDLESEDTPKVDNKTELAHYTSSFKPSKISESRLVQVAYFNGMGVGGLIGPDSTLVDNVQDSLVYLSTHNRDGSVAKSDRKLNYSDSLESSGRLVLYSMEQDPISYIGLHYGEILKLNTAADALTNHRDQHSMDVKDIAASINNLVSQSSTEELSFWEKLTGKKTKEKSFSEKIAELFINLKDSNIVDLDLETVLKNKGKLENFPKIVTDSIKLSNDATPTSINLLSMVSNLVNGVVDYNDQYGLLSLDKASGLFGIIDHFNVNHETDSFVCINDSDGSGVINNIDLIVQGGNKNFVCNGSNCYSKKSYNDNSFASNISIKTNTEKYIGDNIYLKAVIDGACARRYIWEYSNNNGATWERLGETTDNRFVIPKNKISEDGKTYSFRVSATYGDAFQVAKTKFNSEGYDIVLDKIYTANPTISEGLTVREVGNVEGHRAIKTSNVLNVSLIKDTTAPKCDIDKSVSIKLKCKLLSCKAQIVNKAVTCSDSSGIKEMKITQFKVDQGGVTLIPSISANNNGNKTVINNGNSVFNYSITAKRKPSWNKPSVTIKGEAIDNAGNKTTFSQKISVNISK